MIKIGLKRNSIIVRLLLSMLAVLLIQTLLLAGNIWYGGTIDELNKNSVDVLDEKVISRTNHIQNEMVQRWSNIAKFEHDIQDEMNYFLQEKNIDYSAFQREPNLAFEFLEQTVDKVVFTIRQCMVTGAFVVLNNENEGRYPGVYIRDSDPLFNPSDNSDLSMEVGHSTAARKAGISLGIGWVPRFNFSEDDDSSAFYFKPLRAASKNPGSNFTELGYWSGPFTLSDYGIKAITYSIPIIDAEGVPYGVIGIELTSDYFRKILYYDEIADNKQGAYLLAITRDGGTVFENVVSSGPAFNKIFGNSTQIELAEKTGYDNVFKINTKHNGTVYGCVHYLNLYDSNTPFEKDRWSLIGIVEEKNLFKSTRQIQLYVAASMLLSLVLGFAGSALIGMWFIKPITGLVQELKSSDPEKPIALTRTNIAEIDDLAQSVEVLSIKVAESAAELSKIISMMEIPLCAFEHDLKNDKLICTDTFFELMGIKSSENKSEYITPAYFYGILDELRKSPEPDMEDVYRYENDTGSVKWLRIKIQQSDNKILGIIEDVTREVIEKRKIEYERDHDLLTHLLNRRAFQAEVSKRLKEEDVKTAAFIIWDLDNLKYINDTYGHDFGDKYIKNAANILSELTIYNSVVGRMSGDEFYAFIYGYEDKQQIKEIVEMIQDKLSSKVMKLPDGTNLHIRASAGIAWYPEDSKNYRELIKYSDFAMYEMKNKSKGNVGEFNKKSYNKKSYLINGKGELDHLLEEELIDFVFQPIVNARNGEVFAYEALMRSKNSDLLTSPETIITLADSQAKLYDIERITWFKVMEAFQRYKEDFGDAKIFINSLASHILSDQDLQRFEDKYKSDLHRIVAEITESEQADEKIIRKKQRIAERWNSYIALDDFGSGYNLGVTFLTFCPDFVKLDMVITRGIDRDLNRQNFVKALLQYTRSRKVRIIAEGIETKAEMNTLIELGVDCLQGYYIGRPSHKPQSISPKVIREICKP